MGKEYKEGRKYKYPILKNPSHMLFAVEYLATLDAPRSYMKAYPNSSLKSAYVSASNLLARDDIQEFMDDYTRSMIRESKVMYSKQSELMLDPDRLVNELAKMAYAPDFRYPETKLKAMELLAKLNGAFERVEEEKDEGGEED